MNYKSKKLLYLERILKLMAILVLKKYGPKIIGITGSVGKSSTKEAVFTVLATHYRTRKNEKNYNNEIGLPLTVIGSESGGKSFWGWTKVSLKWLGTILFPLEYPEVLVLEMAADRPGDMKYLVDFIKPQMGILTDISGSHMEFFKNLEGITREKGELVKNLGEKGTAILNIDNPQIKKIKNQTKAKNITFGFSEEADVRATDVHYNYLDTANPNDAEIRGISFKLNYKGTTIPMRLNNILAEHNIYAALAGVAVGLEMGLNLVEIGAALESFVLPYGRMNLIPGIKNSAIIDDTYNSSPISAIAALKVLGEIKGKRKIAVLGDMLELGPDTEEGHREIARKFLEIKGDMLIAVGRRMKYAVDELTKHNTDEKRIIVFDDPMSAGRKLQEVMEEGDIILVKGSQGMRMEKVVEEVMSEPNRAAEYLCRQDKKWKNKPWREV
ncbi:MAG TPA: UDP-N-acetylmuramoyl-tripeptide--D-alanyl-D-alanine ligase [Candidatus Moranbacteria bacterium]|nr:UDP-N-acetylmuramoyl-tripeptide--D-alanyl-D-alanine ligase [Candidatus Moranbacteria bacterium]